MTGIDAIEERVDVGLKADRGEVLELSDSESFVEQAGANRSDKASFVDDRDIDGDGLQAEWAFGRAYGPASLALPAGGRMGPLSDESIFSYDSARRRSGLHDRQAGLRLLEFLVAAQLHSLAGYALPDRSAAAREPQPAKPPATWSPEAIELAKSLLRTESLKKLEGGVELRTVSESFDPRWNRRTSRHAGLSLYSPKAWLTRPLDLDAQTIINYCNSKERGAYSLALLLGRVRKSVEHDLGTPPLELSDWSLSRLDEAYRGYEAKVIKGDAPDRAVLVLTVKNNSDFEQRFTIDTARHVLVKIESLDKGKVTSTTTFTDFVQLAGGWWARKVTTIDAKERKTGETTLDITALTAEKFSARIDAELAAKPHVQFLQIPSAEAEGRAAARRRRLGRIRRPHRHDALRRLAPAMGRVAQAACGDREGGGRQAGHPLAAADLAGHNAPQ